MNDEKPLDMLQIQIDRAREELPQETRKAIDSVDWRAVILSFREKKGYSYEQLEDLELETELLLCGLSNPVDYPKELEKRLKLPRPQVDLLVNEMNELVFKKIKDELIRNSERKEIFVKKEEAEVKIPTQNTNQDFANMKMPSTPTSTQNTSITIKIAPEIPLSPPASPSEALRAGNLPLSKGEEKVLSNTSGQGGELTSSIPTPIKPSASSAIDNTLEDPKNTKSILSQKLSGTFQVPTAKTQYSSDNISKAGLIQTGDTIKTKKTDPYRIDPNE